MTPPLHEIFLARDYLQTYYPSDFDQEAFFSAVQLVRQKMLGTGKTLDAQELSSGGLLPSEVVENAVIFCFLEMVASRLLEIFPRGDAVLLDVGGGPTLYQHIPLCLNVDTIIHGDFLPENQREALMYLDRDSQAYSWKNYFSMVQKMLRENEQYQSWLDAQVFSNDNAIKNRAERLKGILFSNDTGIFEERLRQVLKRNVISCDVFSPNLERDGQSLLARALEKTTHRGFPDIISSHFLVESATGDYEQWKKGVAHLVDFLPQGGCFIMTAIRNASWYKVGTERVPAVPIDEQIIEKFLTEHGIVVEDTWVLLGSDKENHGYDGMVFVFARK